MSNEPQEVAELLEQLLAMVKKSEPTKQLYTPKEVAGMFHRAEGTIRDNCRMERIRSIKRGRSRFIPHHEVERLRNSHFELLTPNFDKVPPSLKPKYSASQSVAV